MWVGKVIGLGFMMFDLLVSSWSFRNVFSLLSKEMRFLLKWELVEWWTLLCLFACMLTRLLIVFTSYVLNFVVIMCSFDLVYLIG
jgi:hypothetical protein